MESRLDRVIGDYNELGNRLEAQYLEKRDEPTLELVITLDSLKTILLGTICCDNHNISSMVANGKEITVKLEKI